MSDVTTGHRPLLSYWPIAVGLAAAAFQIVTDVAAEAVAITVVVAAACYLAAAAFDRRWVAWATVLGASLVVVVVERAGGRWWVGMLVLLGVLLAVGWLRRAPAGPLTAQGLAMLGFGAVAVIAVLADSRWGLALAGAALASHAVWDVIHWRRNIVVPRSLAEACLFLDVPFGVAAVVLAVTA